MTTNALFPHLRIAALLGVLFAFSNFGQAQTPIVLDPPAGTVDGVNVINGSTVIVQLRAPGKDKSKGKVRHSESTLDSLVVTW